MTSQWPNIAWGGCFLLAVLGSSVLAARMLPRVAWLARPAALLERRGCALVIGCLCALLTWWFWGSLDAFPVVHDEAAYLLQAQIFARGVWALPSPPLPEFFEQFHVFVEPTLAPKYPPGHALALVPGIWLGLPGLMPVLLNGLTGGLIFALARRVSTPAVGLLAVILWLVSPSTLAFRASYYSEVTNGALILIAWWGLLEWRARGSLRWLVLVSLALAWGGITRPLTTLAFALPIGAVVLVGAWRGGRLRQVPLAALAGLPVVLLLPLHSMGVSGEPHLTLYPLYSAAYQPFDHPGFTHEDAAPTRDLPLDMRQFNRGFTELYNAHTLESLPGNLARRAFALLRSCWGMAWIGMAPLFVVGLFSIGLSSVGASIGLAALSVLFVLLTYAIYAHAPDWYIYYLEAQMVVVFLTALGIRRTVAWIMGTRLLGGAAVAPSPAAREAVALGLVVLLMLPFIQPEVARIRSNHANLRSGQGAFHELMAQAPEAVLVFVRHSPTHNVHFSLVTNVPDRESARALVVRDRGADNARLLPYFPDRKPFLFHEESGQLVPMDPRTGTVDEEALRVH